MKKTMLIAAAAVLLAAGAAYAMQGHGSAGHGGTPPAGQSMDHSQMGQPAAGQSMDHSQMGQQPAAADGGFHHMGHAEGIKAEFQVMSLASMNMQDASGATHHVMVKLYNEGTGAPVTDAVGKVKVISPSKQETVVDLTNYGGTFAANFKAEEPGQYGIICLLKAGEKKPMYKFWYPRE
jgi:hypothetical protein